MHSTEMINVFKHVMVDIETMGTSSDSAIISIGAVEFCINTGNTGREFYRNVSLESSMSNGLKVDASTIMWWMGQSDEARSSLTKDSVSLEKALLDFKDFFPKDCKVWANPPSFDLVILKNAFSAINQKAPWNFRNERCLRTLSSMAQDIKNRHSPDVAHNALSDCYYQIGYCVETWNFFKGD